MNRLLQLNKNILILILVCISLIFIFTLVLKNFETSENVEEIKDESSIFDVTNPRFTIKNNKQKIIVNAKRGNFLTKKTILLEKDVVFKSPKFTLKTDSVIFNQEDQTAKSTQKSTFNSDGTTIISEGFEITNNGNVIFFNGKTNLFLNNNSSE